MNYPSIARKILLSLPNTKFNAKQIARFEASFNLDFNTADEWLSHSNPKHKEEEAKHIIAKSIYFLERTVTRNNTCYPLDVAVLLFKDWNKFSARLNRASPIDKNKANQESLRLLLEDGFVSRLGAGLGGLLAVIKHLPSKSLLNKKGFLSFLGINNTLYSSTFRMLQKAGFNISDIEALLK